MIVRKIGFLELKLSAQISPVGIQEFDDIHPKNDFFSVFKIIDEISHQKYSSKDVIPPAPSSPSRAQRDGGGASEVIALTEFSSPLKRERSSGLFVFGDIYEIRI